MRKGLLTSIVLLLSFFILGVWAQTVNGTVTDESGEAIPGVTVLVEGTANGTATSVNGDFSIEMNGGTILTFQAVGLETQSVDVSGESSINVEMLEGVSTLESIVVTGVSEGTSTTKTSFSVAKVNESLLGEVPALDPANALRGKVAGVQIVQTSGVPGTAGSINLRGSTAIAGVSQQPLIIVDGVITPPGSANLADINMNDVESIEVLKGAAGSSIYGSLAANGVVQIITKRGSGRQGQTRITLRNEFGFSDIMRNPDDLLSNSHFFEVNPDGSYALDANGQRINDAEALYDNPYPQTFDQFDDVFTDGLYYSNFVSVGASLAKTNVYASYENLTQESIVRRLNSYNRQSVRLNVDQDISDKLRVSLSGSYIFSEGPRPNQGGQSSSNIIYGLLLTEPDVDLTLPNSDGTQFFTEQRPDGQGANVGNPLYIADQGNNLRLAERERFLGAATINYEPLDWLRLEGQISIDRSTENRSNFQKRDYIQPNGATSTGSIQKYNSNSSASVASASAYFNRTFGDFTLGATLRYITEEYITELAFTQGSNLAANDIQQLQLADPTSLNTGSQEQTFRAENFMFNVRADYRDTYILDALVRQDQSSLFGPDVRSQTFYRLSLAYRLTQDIDIPGIDEFKIRASIGTSGQRPPFAAQYETFTVNQGQVIPSQLGNNNIKPSIIQELEIGTDIAFLERFNFEFNYATVQGKDQILLVPLASNAGFSAQYQNAGDIESSTIELALNGDIFSNTEVKWNVGITATRSRTKVTSLNTNEFTLGGFDNTPLFRIKEGDELGVIYGRVLATSIDQLTTDESGFVNNLITEQGNGTDPTTLTPQDFTVNSDGLLIENGTEGTENEAGYYIAEDGVAIDAPIGNTNPDVILGFNSTVSYKNFSLYMSMDAQIGGDIANVTRQNLIFNDRAGVLENSGKYQPYYASINNSGGSLTSFNIEDADYLSMRELSLSYLFDNKFWERAGIGNFIYDAKLSISARNLFMITNYSGFSPDVSGVNAQTISDSGDQALLNPTIFRYDGYNMPLFRTYSASLQIRF